MTDDCRSEAEQFASSAEGQERATSDQERVEDRRRSAHRFEPFFGAKLSCGDTVTTDHKKAVKVTRYAHDIGVKGFPGPTSYGPLVDTSRIPSTPWRSYRSISGSNAEGETRTVLDSREQGPGFQ